MSILLTALAGLGIDFVSGLVSDHGEDLVKAGIEKVTGIDLSKKKLTPEDIQKIKDHEIQIRQLDFDELKIHMEDRNSARDMQAEALRQDDLFSKRYVYYLATFIVSISFAYIFLITFTVIPEENVRFADTVLGFLLGIGLAQVFNFFFGSSKGSKDKTEAMAKALK